MPSRLLQRHRRCLSTFLPLLLACAVMANASAQIVDTPNTLYRIVDGTKKTGNPKGTGSRAIFQLPMGIVYKNNALWVVDQSTNSLSRIDRNGQVEKVVGSAEACGRSDGPKSSARLCRPMGLAVDAGGTLYIADSWFSAIRDFDGETVSTRPEVTKSCNRIDDPAGNPLCSPLALTVDGNNLYVVDIKSDLYRIDLTTRAATKIAGTHGCGRNDDDEKSGTAASFCAPQGIAINPVTGVIYVADTDSQTIRKVTPEGKVTTFAGEAGVCGSTDSPKPGSTKSPEARFCVPRGIAIDSAGNLYVADKGNGKIRKITPDGMVSTLAGSPGIPKTVLGPLPGAIAYPLAISVIGENQLAVTTENGDILGINF